MDELAIMGFACLGLFVGLIIGWFLNQDALLDAKSVSTIVGVVGSTAISFVPLFAPRGGREVWFYPIALLVGLLIAPFLDKAYDKLYSKNVKTRRT